MEEPLSKMILQPDSLRLSGTGGQQKMTEVWKGPWSEVRKLTSLKNDTIYGIRIIPGQPRPNFEGSQLWTSEFAVPKAVVDDKEVKWAVESVEARQLQAGDHGTITISYSSMLENAEGGGDPSEPDAPDNAELVKPTTWDLNWGTFTRSPLEYATDITGGRANDILNCLKNDHPASLEQARSMNPAVTAENFRYCYFMGTKDIYRRVELLTSTHTQSAWDIYDYMVKGVTPQFHYPIVSKQVHFKIPAGVTLTFANVGSDIDKITELPGDSPFIFEKQWEWVKTDDKYQVVRSDFDGTEYTRTLTWTGAVDWDDNFYGQDAWEPN